MCGGVQNVSRPMERCHEISHSTPTIAEVTPTIDAHRYHGSLFWFCIVDVHLFRHATDDVDGAIQNLRPVFRRDDRANARLALRHSGESDARGEQAFLEQS